RTLLPTTLALLVCGSAPVESVAQSCSPQPPNLAGWWPGNGSAQDVINGNNGTLQNGVGSVAGEVSQAFNLDGTNQWVDVPSSAALKPASQLTISAWIKLSAVPTGQGADVVAK